MQNDDMEEETGLGVWKKTLCNLCAMTCGLEMEVEDNRIINVRPDPDSPSSECYCCRKGRSAKCQACYKSCFCCCNGRIVGARKR